MREKEHMKFQQQHPAQQRQVLSLIPDLVSAHASLSETVTRELRMDGSLRLIIQHFPIINRPCGVLFIFKAVYLPPLPVLCILCLCRTEWTT